MVVVADDHEAVASVEFLLAPEDAAADLLVEVVGPAVGPGNDHHFLFTISVVEVIEQFRQVIASDGVQVWVRSGVELGKWGIDVFRQVLGQGNVLPQGMGIREYAAVQFLTDNVIEGAFGEGEVEFAGQPWAVESGGDGTANGRKLGVVTHQDDPAAGGLQAELKKVREEVALPEPSTCCAGLPKTTVAANHGGLIHDEDGSLAGIGRNTRRCPAIWGGFAEIDAPVDGAGLEAGIAAHDLRCASSWRKQFDGPAEVAEDADQGGHGGGLSRSGISANHQATARLRAH